MPEELLSLSDSFDRAHSLVFKLWIEAGQHSRLTNLHAQKKLKSIWLYCSQQVRATMTPEEKITHEREMRLRADLGLD